MDISNISVGMKVCFHSRVFSPPYTPYYDSYKGHTFEVVAIHPGEHIELKCLTDPTFKMQGCPHADELKLM